jgi:hypothetical protein
MDTSTNRRGDKHARLRDRAPIPEVAEGRPSPFDWGPESDPVKDADATVADLAARFRDLIGLKDRPQNSK